MDRTCDKRRRKTKGSHRRKDGGKEDDRKTTKRDVGLTDSDVVCRYEEED